MANKIQIRRGLRNDLPELSPGEPGLATNTGETFIGTGFGNVHMDGDKWFKGTDLSGTTATANVHSYAACPAVKVGDGYMNTSNGNVYECTTAGTGNNAKWTYKGCLKGAQGPAGTTDYNNLTNKPTSLKNPASLTIQFNGASQGAYDGSAAKTVNITPAGIGAANAEPILLTDENLDDIITSGTYVAYGGNGCTASGELLNSTANVSPIISGMQLDGFMLNVTDVGGIIYQKLTYFTDCYVRNKAGIWDEWFYACGPTKKEKTTATFVIGTTTSKHDKSRTNYLCTGTNDHTVINNAIKALPATGGKIVLLEGTYNCSGQIDVAKPNVTIEGMGRGNTVINYTGSSMYGMRISQSRCEVRQLSIIRPKTLGYTNQIGIYIYGADSINCIVSDVEVSGFNSGVEATQSNTNLYALFKSVYSLNNGTGIHINSNRCMVKDCFCVDNDRNGIEIFGHYNKIDNNYVIRGTGQASDYTSSQYSIRIANGGDYNDISANYILGKNYVNSGGSANTFNNNRYE